MDWMVYWFMLPACVGIASVAMFSGISGAAMLMPVFLIAFPLLGVPPIGTVAAVGMSLFLETAGFGTGVYGYLGRHLVDRRTALRLAMVAVPAAVVGSLVTGFMPTQLIRVGYAAAMIVIASVMLRAPSRRSPPPGGKPNRIIETTDGLVYSYRAHRLGIQGGFSAFGAFVAGVISTGVGEATLPGLVRRSGFPVPVAAATSTVVVAATVAGAAVTHVVALTVGAGWSAVPWNLLVWAVPGAVIGAFLGTRWQGRVSEAASRRFVGVLFLGIGVVVLSAFTVFRGRFA